MKKQDLLVSCAIVEQGAWEEHNVKNLMKAMSLYDSAVFIGKILYFITLSNSKYCLDGGCNIGMYTIMVAAMGREVVAVDAMADNLAYVRRSLEIQNREHLVTLLHNAIRQVQMKIHLHLIFFYQQHPC